MGRAFEYRKAAKFARWDRMAKQFTKAGKQITMAVKRGGDDPDANLELRRAIQNAKSVQMPKDRIEAAIEKGLGKDADELNEVVYEGMAPHGVAVVVETATDNPTRTVANVRSIFNKNGGSLGTQGMHDFNFDRKGVFYVEVGKIPDREVFELEMIDHGLERIDHRDTDEEGNAVDQYMVYVDFTDFGKMQEALEDRSIELVKSELERIPKFTQNDLSEDQVDEVLELIDALEQDEDVQSVFHSLD